MKHRGRGPTLGSTCAFAGPWRSGLEEPSERFEVLDFERPAESAQVHVRQLGPVAVVERQRVRVSLAVVEDGVAALAGPLLQLLNGF